MAISAADRLRLHDYLLNLPAIATAPMFNNSGPCGTFAKNLVENGTGKIVVNPHTVFLSTAAAFMVSYRCTHIAAYNDYIRLTHTGDLLCFVGLAPGIVTPRPLHYVVRTNINGINVIGTNGLLTDPASEPYRGAILTIIGPGHFRAAAGTDTFLYDPGAGRYVALYRIEYTLF